MDYVIVKIKGHQYKVKPGDTVLLPRFEAKEGSRLSFSEVLLAIEGESVRVGTPYVKGMNITAQVEGHLKGEKIRVATYKSKSRYRRVKGYRDYLTRVKITAITSASAVTSAERKRSVEITRVDKSNQALRSTSGGDIVSREKKTRTKSKSKIQNKAEKK